MNPGEMSYPVRAGGGYYLLLLRQRRTLGAPDPDDAVLSMVQVMLPLQRGAATPAADERGGPRNRRTTAISTGNAPPEEEQRVLQRAQQISASAKGCEELAKIGKAEAPETSREVETRVGDLSPQLRQVLLKLAIGKASKPMPVPGGAGIFMVCSKKDAPGGLPSRDKITDHSRAETGLTGATLSAGCAPQRLCGHSRVTALTPSPQRRAEHFVSDIQRREHGHFQRVHHVRGFRDGAHLAVDVGSQLFQVFLVVVRADVVALVVNFDFQFSAPRLAAAIVSHWRGSRNGVIALAAGWSS